MKKLSLKKKDAFELSLAISAMVNNKSQDIDFKDIISLQKTSSDIKPLVKDYSDGIEQIENAKKDIVDAANNKITEYRAAQLKRDLTGATKELMEEFTNTVLNETKAQVDKEIAPRYDKLNKEIGDKNVELELEEAKHKTLVDAFEKFGKDIYLNKEKMVEVYEVLNAAK